MNNIPIFPPNDSVVTRMDPLDIADRLQIMRRQEETTYKCTDYLSQHQTFSDYLSQYKKSFSVFQQNTSQQQQNENVDTTARLKMCEWCHQIASFCDYQSETVSIGISLLDQYLSKYSEDESVFIALSDSKQFQLAALTTLYMAIKLHEPVVLDVKTLSEISRGCYSMEDIEQMEREILKTINWRVNRPSELEFIHHFLSLLPSNVSSEVKKRILNFSQYQSDLAVLDYQFVTVNPSIVALASVLNSLEERIIEFDDDDDDALLFGFEERIKFLQLLSDTYGDIDPVELDETRIALLELLEEHDPKESSRRRCELKKGSNFVSKMISTIFISNEQGSTTKKQLVRSNGEKRGIHQNRIEPMFSLFRTM